MKTIKFFVAIIWSIIFLYTSSFLLEMMSMPNTTSLVIGFLGMVLITYLSFKTRLGIKLITKKTKQNEKK